MGFRDEWGLLTSARRAGPGNWGITAGPTPALLYVWRYGERGCGASVSDGISGNVEATVQRLARLYAEAGPRIGCRLVEANVLLVRRRAKRCPCCWCAQPCG